MNPLERYLYHLQRLWWFVAAAVIAAGVVGYGIASASPPNYRATAILLVSPNRTADTVVLDDILISERLTSTYEKLIVTRPVLEQVARGLHGEETADDLKVGASALPGTQLIRVSAESGQPERAALIANTVTGVFIQQNNLSQEGTRLGTVTVVEDAEPPESPQGPSISVRTFAGLLAGASLALVVIAGRAHFDGSIWEPDDLKATGCQLPCLGIIPMAALDGVSGLDRILHVPHVTEPYETLAATVLAALDLRKGSTTCQAVAVMSSRRGEGRTSVVARLGVAFARGGHSVSVVDFDLRRPSLHEQFGLRNASGITDLLAASRISAQNPGHETTLVRDRLRVMTSGRTKGIAIALHAHEAGAALGWLKAEEPDFVLVDTPPFQDGSDAVVLADLVDSAIVLAEARRTPADEVASAAARLDAMGVDVLGFVINKR